MEALKPTSPHGHKTETLSAMSLSSLIRWMDLHPKMLILVLLVGALLRLAFVIWLPSPNQIERIVFDKDALC